MQAYISILISAGEEYTLNFVITKVIYLHDPNTFTLWVFLISLLPKLIEFARLSQFVLALALLFSPSHTDQPFLLHFPQRSCCGYCKEWKTTTCNYMSGFSSFTVTTKKLSHLFYPRKTYSPLNPFSSCLIPVLLPTIFPRVVNIFNSFSFLGLSQTATVDSL